MKILIVGSNSILSKAILNQHLDDEVDVLYNSKTSENYFRQFPMDDLIQLNDEYDYVYIVSAILSNHLDDIDMLFHVNVKLVKNISYQFPSAKLIYFSTVSVFDGLSDIIISENTTPTPESFYGISKLWAEKVIMKHSKFSILRISSMYGIGMKNLTFLPKIIDDAISKKQIRIFGDGLRYQNYIKVDDVAVLAKKTAELNENTVQLAIDKINYSNRQLAEIIKNETDCEILYEGFDSSRSVEYSQNTFPYSAYNITSLEKGIKELIEWKRKQF